MILAFDDKTVYAASENVPVDQVAEWSKNSVLLEQPLLEWIMANVKHGVAFKVVPIAPLTDRIVAHFIDERDAVIFKMFWQ